MIFGDAVGFPERMSATPVRDIDAARELLLQGGSQLGDDLVKHTERPVLFVLPSLFFGNFFGELCVLMNFCVTLFAQAYDIGQGIAPSP